ncbi:glycine oxidase ThiO [Paenibacillus eucommiae]|uniref:glycine oxidase n=1 Tax=Paenibacillus eucommiae TaxID=1355755 RepID=A0ABS4IX61_9BACL|nr:glycine oxidase ThiO [Paenibacillus eucommiae]MBP1992180.1 glycine oxidase [Paenibacillus eucommiae]
MGESIVIMGGGVIGLSCAFELQSRGSKVTVLEPNNCGGQASGAAAGMLAPYSENVEGPDDFFRLCLDSLRLYPKWQETIKQVSGQTFEYTNSGSLYTAFHQADLLALEGRLLWQRQFGSSGSILSGDELLRLEPLLSKNVQAALYTPEESHVYAPHYVSALEQACRVIGVNIQENLERVEIVQWQQEVLVRSADHRLFSGDKLLVCSGAWAGELASTFGLYIPVHPIRGQICAYECEPAVHPVNHMVFSSQGYLVAKENGTLVCGASEDIAGFDTSVTAKGIERLQRWNKGVFPFLNELVPFHRWAGLRPSTQDGLPLIGPVGGSNESLGSNRSNRSSQSSRVMLAVGHYRNGILLSPVTAKLAADWVYGNSSISPTSGISTTSSSTRSSIRSSTPSSTRSIEAFSPERFGRGLRV